MAQTNRLLGMGGWGVGVGFAVWQLIKFPKRPQRQTIFYVLLSQYQNNVKLLSEAIISRTGSLWSRAFELPPTFCCIVACASAASFVCVKGNIASVSCGVGATSVTSVIKKSVARFAVESVTKY